MDFIGRGDAQFSMVLPFCLCIAILALGAHNLGAQGQESSPAVPYAISGTEAVDAAGAEEGPEGYTLKIVFADLRGRSIREIELRIVNEQGRELLKLSDAGPVFLAKLSPGVYNLELTYRGESKSIAGVKISEKKTKELYLYWY